LFGYETISMVSSLTSDFDPLIAGPFPNGKIIKKKYVRLVQSSFLTIFIGKLLWNSWFKIWWGLRQFRLFHRQIAIILALRKISFGSIKMACRMLQNRTKHCQKRLRYFSAFCVFFLKKNGKRCKISARAWE